MGRRSSDAIAAVVVSEESAWIARINELCDAGREMDRLQYQYADSYLRSVAIGVCQQPHYTNP